MTDEPSTPPTRQTGEQHAQERTDGRLSRRTYVKALGTATVAGVATPTALGSATAQDGGFDSFVETDGSQFVVDGEPIYFNGSNNFWLTDASSGSQERVDAVFDVFEEMGIGLVRMWANGAGSGLLQPTAGEHDEQQLRLHDYVVKVAGERGIRLIPSLVDNWEWEGGMLQYASWTGGNSREHFYTNQEARDLYRNHVETMVTRENYYTGVEWREDPTIMMWELANEPRLEADDTEGGGNFDRQSGEHRDILGNWIQEMSSYVKELDSNHLVSTGSEGHFYRQGGSYPDGTWGGQDFVEHHSYDTIDAASFHWYPDHWWCHSNCNDLSQVPLDRGPDWITNHAQAAHEDLDKPAYLGEFNVRAERPNANQPSLSQGDGHSLSTREQHLETYYQAADEADLDAMVVWQIVQSSTQDHDGFQIYPEDASADIIRNYADVVAEKSGDGTTPTVPTSPAEQWTNEATASTIEMSWDPVEAAAQYNVYLGGDHLESTTETTYTISDLESGTTYTIGLSSENEAGESDVAETDVTTAQGSPCGEDAASETLSDGSTVCDLDGDGQYRDVTGDGSVTNSDVTEFFGNQHADPWDSRADLFDFTGDDDVTQADVIELFGSVN